MNTDGKVWHVLRKPWAIFFGIISALLVFVTLYQLWQAWGIVLALLILAIVCILNSILLAKGTIRPKHLKESQKIQVALTDLLKKTKKSLYYFGGAGFIGDYKDWRETFTRKLENEQIEVVRLIDLKDPRELREYLAEHRVHHEDVREDRINDYRKWLATHATYLTEEFRNNCFYDFEGAPVWRYGMNYIIFDRRFVAFISPHVGDEKRAVILDSPEIAEDLVESINWITGQFHLDPLTGDYLQKLSEM